MSALGYDQSALASQAAFRAVMDAFARPGEPRPLAGVEAAHPLAPAAAAVLRTLADYETPVWLDSMLAQGMAVGDWIRFETSASLVRQPRDAAFALIGDPQNMPDFADFALGSEDYPDRSTTLIVQVDSFRGTPLTLSGPGIKGARSFAAQPVPDDLVARLAANRELFPRGIDLIFATRTAVAALPRSVRVTAGRG